MESAISFAPLRPAGFVNFTGKACFLWDGRAGRGSLFFRYNLKKGTSKGSEEGPQIPPSHHPPSPPKSSRYGNLGESTCI